MNTVEGPAAASQADRAELADLVARQGLWLDEGDFANAGAIFTSDAVVRTQGGNPAAWTHSPRRRAGFTSRMTPPSTSRPTC
jgi:SnoaL-like domain